MSQDPDIATSDPVSGCDHQANLDHARLDQIRAQARGGWFSTAAETEFLLDLLVQRDAEVERITDLVRDLHDPEPCSFDHGGGCQAHGYLSLSPGETCPQHDARVLLAGTDAP